MDEAVRLHIATVYRKYLRWSKHNSTSECIDKRSFLRQVVSEEYYIENKTMRIGGINRNAISLDFSSMPDDMDTDWPGYQRIAFS